MLVLVANRISAAEQISVKKFLTILVSTKYRLVSSINCTFHYGKVHKPESNSKSYISNFLYIKFTMKRISSKLIVNKQELYSSCIRALRPNQPSLTDIRLGPTCISSTISLENFAMHLLFIFPAS